MLEQLMNDFDVWMEDFFPQACQAATKGEVQGKALCAVIFKGEFKGAKWFPSEAIPLLKDYVFIPVSTLAPDEDKGRWTLSDFREARAQMIRKFTLILILENRRQMEEMEAYGERIRKDFDLIESRYLEKEDHHDDQ